MGISNESACSIKLTMRFDKTVLATGTGFYWRNGDEVYLVTNRHNVTGRHQETGECLDTKFQAIPNNIIANCWFRAVGEQPKFISGDLRLQWQLGSASSWLEHPDRSVDVVMWKLESAPENTGFQAVNDENPGVFKLIVASDVYILGYPLGIGVSDLPIWKRGTIASEPELDVDNSPIVLVDTASNKGMSGSPVIFKANSGVSADGNNNILGGANSTDFVGVYSGRVVREGDLGAQLGIIWKAQVLDEILKYGENLISE